ncbi:TonB-dependent siderophore receptor [Achromobacter pestifer]|uniref:Ferripyoverdine receptor n=1 Tax=Achromobacter pestifer TaxID=1353889 RepID=A0A6S6ZKL2_9BURK|nr:TonB-dependent receptor [Achromobacter pestifer]CAB3678992.1 Ferripyoverdine receptor [Achromobacter pestifer]
MPPRFSHLRASVFRHALRGATAFAFPLAGMMAPAHAQTASGQVTVAIEPGPLSAAVSAYAARAGVLLSFDPALTRDLRSPGLNGTYGFEEGLRQLLAGSGLESARRPDGGYTLRRLPLGEVTSLPAVTVTGNRDGDAPTEGSGSYTAPASGVATRMGLSLRETPQSISVVTRQQMDDQNLVTLDEVLRQTPGIVADRLDERVRFTSRGFELNTMIDGLPTLAFSGVAAEASMFNTAIYDRVDVLRGAAGLLNGVGTPGGAINLVRKRPTEEFAGSVTAGAGSWNRYLTEADLRGGLNASGSVRGRIVASHSAGDSFIDDKKRKDDVFYGIVEADLTANTLLTAGYEYEKTAIDGANFGQSPLYFNDGTRTDLPRSFNSSTPWSVWNMTTQRAFLNLEHRFANEWRVKAEAAYMKNDRKRYGGDLWLWPSDINPDTGEGVLDLGNNPAGSTNKSFDIYATGPFQLFGRTHQASVGFNLNSYSNWVSGTSAVPGGDDKRPINIYQMSAIPKPDFPYPAFKFGTDTEERALYGSTRLKLADPLSLLLGARVSWYRSTDWDRSWADGGDGHRTVAAPTRESSVFTPYAGIVYDVSQNYSVYASYTDIFQPNTARDRNNQVLDPKRGKNMELGIKGEHFDGALNTSFAVFRTQEDNVGVDDVGAPPLPDGTAPQRAEKGARSQGFELTAAGEVLAGWQVMAGYTYHAKRDKHDVLMNPTYPRRLLRIATSYRLPGDWNKLTVGGSLSYQSDIYFDEYYGLGRVRQGGLTLLGLMARYDISKNVSTSLNVENLTDKRYYAGLGGYNGYTYGNPRNVWLRVKYQF